MEVTICLFAKAPILGQVKTRMQRVLTPAECLALHCKLLETCCANLAQAPSACSVELHVTALHSHFADLSQRHGFAIKQQRGRHLGARMSHAVRQSLRCAEAVVLVGADCPSVKGRLLSDMLSHLQTTDAVMIPAHDGGYVALGVKRYAPELFCNIAWGSSLVAEETRRRLEALQWSWVEMPAQADIDRPEDLALLEGD